MHTHGKHADVLAGVVARVLGVRVVSTLHLIEDEERGLARAVVRASAAVRGATASRVLAVSEAQRQWYLDSFPRTDPGSVVTVPNGVVDLVRSSADERRRVRAELGAGPDDVLALALGMMRPDRGHETLVRAACRLRDPSVVVAVVGDGPRRSALEDLARALGGAAVRFPGYRTDVDALLQAADVLVHPSLSDALPTALLQGLAAGVPVVASDVGGVREIVTPDVGVLVRAGDPVALAEALAREAGDASRRAVHAVAARRRYEEHFTAQVWGRRLQRVYAEVTAPAPEVSRHPL